jgi:hypothetical protein
MSSPDAWREIDRCLPADAADVERSLRLASAIVALRNITDGAFRGESWRIALEPPNGSQASSPGV